MKRGLSSIVLGEEAPKSDRGISTPSMDSEEKDEAFQAFWDALKADDMGAAKSALELFVSCCEEGEEEEGED